MVANGRRPLTGHLYPVNDFYFYSSDNLNQISQAQEKSAGSMYTLACSLNIINQCFTENVA